METVRVPGYNSHPGKGHFHQLPWFEYFNSNVECPKNITSISLELTFTLVRAHFYKQSHWMTEMSLVFIKSIKAA